MDDKYGIGESPPILVSYETFKLLDKHFGGDTIGKQEKRDYELGKKVEAELNAKFRRGKN